MLVRDLIALLEAVDQDLEVRLTMNWEYDGDVASVYVDSGTLYLDDCTVGEYDRSTVLYNAE